MSPTLTVTPELKALLRRVKLGRCLDKALRLLAKQGSEGFLGGHQMLEQVERHRGSRNRRPGQP